MVDSVTNVPIRVINMPPVAIIFKSVTPVTDVVTALMSYGCWKFWNWFKQLFVQ